MDSHAIPSPRGTSPNGHGKAGAATVVPATKLVNQLVAAADQKQLPKIILRYGRVGPLCIDEQGDREPARHDAELQVQVLAEREEK